MQNQVFGRAAARKITLDTNEHVLALFHEQCLGGQHVLDFGGADAEGQRAKCTMRAGVRIAANHSHARQRCPLLRPDDVHDTLTQIVHAKFGNAEFFAVCVKRVDLQTRNRIFNAFAAIGSRNVVIGNRQVGT